jgi:hypothetical protein
MIVKPDGQSMWTVVILTQSAGEESPTLTTDFDVYAVASSLKMAKDIVYDLGPYLPSEVLDVQILEAPLVDH